MLPLGGGSRSLRSPPPLLFSSLSCRELVTTPFLATVTCAGPPGLLPCALPGAQVWTNCSATALHPCLLRSCLPGLGPSERGLFSCKTALSSDGMPLLSLRGTRGETFETILPSQPQGPASWIRAKLCLSNVSAGLTVRKRGTLDEDVTRLRVSCSALFRVGCPTFTERDLRREELLGGETSLTLLEE